MPGAGFAPCDLHLTGKANAEFIPSAPDQFVADNDAALLQQFFDVAKAQREAKVPAHR